MQPFELAPGWRIGTTRRQFTLEYLQTPKRQGSISRWRVCGRFGRITDVLDAYVSHALRESTKELPEALQDARRQIEEIHKRIRGPELRIGGGEV